MYLRLLEHTGTDAYDAVAGPWAAYAGAAYRERLATVAGLLGGPLPEQGEPQRARLHEDLWELYALSRVADALLLCFQPPGHDHWAGPGISGEQYPAFFTGLGMAPFEETAVFDPFLHEIVEVEQAADPAEPIRITGVVWPGLWLGGGVLFGRAGVRVRAGSRHAERGVADRSPLYWTFRRRHRPTVDPSMGWGSNSQWRTGFRVDVRTNTGDRLNILGDTHVDAVDADGAEALLTPAERRDLLRHRCLLRTPERADALAARPGWASDLYPYDWR
ncbi:hypothetical protein [Streptomyces sp. NPDC001153]